MGQVTDMLALLDAVYASFTSGDASTWEDMLAEDALCVGTDAAEWWHGKAVMMPVISAQLAEMSAAGVSMTGGDPVVAEGRDVVWAADQPTLQLADGTTLAARLTVIASRQGGKLVVEHVHLSVGAPNEEVLQQDLTVTR